MEDGKANKKGLWTVEEDKVLMDYIRVHGQGKWNRVAKVTGLKRCGKSCRLRWMNYLSPSVKRGDFTEEEEDLIIRLHNLLGNRWSLIAGRVPGRTDNQVKNHWNTHLSKKLGIQKGKMRATTIASSSSCSQPNTRLPAENFPAKLRQSDGGQPTDFSCDGTVSGDKAVEDDCSGNGALRLAGMQSDNDKRGGTLWLSNNDDVNLYSSVVMEPLFEYSLDFLWDDYLDLEFNSCFS